MVYRYVYMLFFFFGKSFFSFISHVSNCGLPLVVDLTPIFCFQIYILLPPFFCLYTYSLTVYPEFLICNVISISVELSPALSPSLSHAMPDSCVLPAFSDWIFGKLYCHSICHSIIFLLINMYAAHGACFWSSGNLNIQIDCSLDIKQLTDGNKSKKGWRKVPTNKSNIFHIAKIPELICLLQEI